jgi:histidine triad (HIT) family protein
MKLTADRRRVARPSYDDANVFAKILRGDLPAHQVYSDADTIAFMDVMPQGNGHTLVVPRRPARNIFDANPETFDPLMRTVQKIARATQRAFDADGVTITQFNEPAAGQTVFHLHFHVIPCFRGEPVKEHRSQREKWDVLAGNAEKIRRALFAEAVA